MNKLLSRLCLGALLLAFGAVFAEPGQGRGGQAGVRPDSPPEQERLRNDERQRQQQEAERRPPKLSREERKELRQQIHEAGHDLYHPKRPQQ